MMTGKVEHVTVSLGSRGYRISIAPDLLADGASDGVELLKLHVAGKKVLLAADSTTGRLYGERILSILKTAGAASAVLHEFPAGESSKNFASVEGICRAAARAGLDRHSLIAALGGGVTGDMAGFAAAIYMRGIPFLQIPTTLLAMIDSSVGGKTGADLPEGKNLIGCFLQPHAVLMDVSFLKTLPPDQIRCGCAELIKHAILFDPELFRELERDPEGILSLRSSDKISALIARSCKLKAGIVEQDEQESGCRALLNLGHTFGHAMEKLSSYRLSHGDAVGLGCAMAATLSERRHLIAPEEAKRIRELLASYGLPRKISGMTPQMIREAMSGDKKNCDGQLRLILPAAIGNCRIFSGIPEEDILAATGEFCD